MPGSARIKPWCVTTCGVALVAAPSCVFPDYTIEVRSDVIDGSGNGGRGGEPAEAGAHAGGSDAGEPGVPTLVVEITTPPTADTVDLTAEGTLDWVHWGYPDTLGVDRKANVATARIGALSGVNSPYLRDFSNGITFSWSDGTPHASQATQDFIYISKLDSGIDFGTVADTTLQTLRVYFGLYSAQGKLKVTLSDGSALPYETTVTAPVDTSLRRMARITFCASHAAQSLHFSWLLNDAGTGTAGGNITLAAATLQ